MGQEIVYCWKCNIRIVGAEFEKGAAFQVGDRATCAGCAGEFLAALPPKDREILLAKMFKAKQARALPRLSTSSRTMPAKPAAPDVRLAASIGAAALALVVVAGILLSRGSTPLPPIPPPTPPPAVALQEKTAREAVARAKAAQDVDARIRAWQEAVFAAEGTSQLAEAKRQLQAATAARGEAVLRDYQKLDEESRIHLRREEFGKALEVLEAGRKRRDEGDWRLRIDQRAAEIRKVAEEALAPLIEKAADAKRRDEAADLKAVEGRVALWGLPELAETLRKSTASVPPAGIFQQTADGLVVLEAENCSAKTAAGGHEWTPMAAPPGYGGTGGMKATPDAGHNVLKNYAAASPKLEFRVNFVKAGTHYFWVRGFDDADNGNSIHAGLDGREEPGLADLRFSAAKKWVWGNKLNAGGPASVQVPAPGLHTFQVWMREDGTSVDRFLLTPDPKYVPNGAGPAESPR